MSVQFHNPSISSQKHPLGCILQSIFIILRPNIKTNLTDYHIFFLQFHTWFSHSQEIWLCFSYILRVFSQRSTFHGATVIYIDLSTAENLFRRAGRFRIDVLLQILSEWSHSVKNWKTTVTGSRRLIINPQCGGIYDFVMREKWIFLIINNQSNLLILSDY